MTHIIALTNQKGGVGKTTTAVNLSACLAAMNKKTLLIDADPQGNSTSGLGFSKQNLKEGFYDFLISEYPLERVIMKTQIDSLEILPTNKDSLALGRELMEIYHQSDSGGQRPEMHFRRRLQQDENKIHQRYDYIIIDSPPNLEILTINIMAAANKLIIPTQPEYYGLEGLADLIETYTRIQKTINPELTILGILITMYNQNNNLSKEVTQNLRQNMGSLVFENIIPRNVRLAEAPSHCLPIILYDLKSTGSISYQALAREVIQKTL